MQLPTVCVEMLLNAEAKALATKGSDGSLNVVPVSTLKMAGEEIVLVNYFFGQTLKNLQSNSEVALAYWKGLEGYQIQAVARHETAGPLFEEVVEWIKEILPERVVKGIVILTPQSVRDVSADATRAGQVVG
jgi:hypothetical protein